MRSLTKLVVLVILILPSRLPGQAAETTAPAKHPQPAPIVAVPTAEAAAPAPDWGNSVGDVFCCPHPGAGRQRRFESVFIMGGQFTKESMGQSKDVFGTIYDNKYLAGFGYQRFPWTWSVLGFYMGWELGTASRFGGDYSHEFWGGAVLRHEGLTLPGDFNLTMALTAGFSAVTDEMGQEAHRVSTRRGDGTFLYYLGPELILSRPRSNWEVFYRLHHRCGGGLSLGKLREGYNANCFGVRFKF